MCSRTFRLEASYSQAVLAHLHLEKWPDGLLDETMSNLPEQLAHHSGWLPHLRGVLWVLTSLRLTMRKKKAIDCSLDILSGVALELLRGVVIDVARLVFLRRELGKGDRLLLSLISFSTVLFCSLFARPRWRFFQSLLADFFLSYQCSLQSYVDHWAPTRVLLGLGDSESSQVPGLMLHITGVSSSDSATLAAKDVCLSVVTVVNSFTESLRLILLPGEDVQKVSFH